MVRLKTKAKLMYALRLWSFIGLVATLGLYTQRFLDAYTSPTGSYTVYTNKLGEANLELCILISYWVAMALYGVLKLTNKTHTISK